MKRRCHSPSDKSYPNYGGRGIKVCPQWFIADGESTGFWQFVEDMGPRPEGCEIDRINNDGDYTPENCRWTTRKQNCRNKRNNILQQTEETCAAEISKKLGGRANLVRNRLANGWTLADALTTKASKFNQKSSMPIIAFKNGTVVGQYKSQREAARSLKLGQGNIRNVLDKNHPAKSTRGYTFKRVESDD